MRQARASNAGAARTWHLAYDGDCRFCRRCVALLGRWDTRRRLAFVPFQDAAALAFLPPVSRAALEQAMHLFAPDGRVFPGAAALPRLLRLLPAGMAFAWLFAVPGIPPLAAGLYRGIARNRHRLGCGSATCGLGR